MKAVSASAAISAHVLAIVAASLLSGCTPRLYSPAAPHHGEVPRLHAEAVTLQTIPSLRVTMKFDSDATPPFKLTHALLAPTESDPCTEGLRERAILIEGRDPWLRPIEIDGNHPMELVFAGSAAGELLQRKIPASIDLKLEASDGQRACLRVPLTGTEPDLAWESSHGGYLGTKLRIFVPATSVDGVGVGLLYGLGLGAQMGRVRAEIDGGAGLAACRNDCFDDPLGFWLLSAAPSLHLFVVETNGAALDLGLGYRWVLAGVGNHDAERTVAIRGPELTLRLAGVSWQGPGLPEGSRVASSGFELSFASWQWSGPTGTTNAFVFGVGGSSDLGF